MQVFSFWARFFLKAGPIPFSSNKFCTNALAALWEKKKSPSCNRDVQMACLVSDVFHIDDMLQLSCVHIIIGI
jgi:hypothetical protein